MQDKRLYESIAITTNNFNDFMQFEESKEKRKRHNSPDYSESGYDSAEFEDA